jgi:hypothetical protein
MLAVVRMFAIAGLLAAASAWAQSGLRLPERAEPGLDPSFARSWLAPEYDRFGFAAYQWRDIYGFAPGPRMRWSYAFGERADLSMSLASPREWDLEQRPLSAFVTRPRLNSGAHAPGSLRSGQHAARRR